jgi:hypothetical protein
VTGDAPSELGVDIPAGAVDATSVADGGEPLDGSGATCLAPDCSNPACSTWGCVAAAPAGWAGYVTLYDGVPTPDPDCPSAFPEKAYEGGAGLANDPATCSACQCDKPKGEICVPGPITVSDDVCGGKPFCAQMLAAPTAGGTCTGTDGAPGGFSNCGPGSGCGAGAAPCNVSVLSTPPTVTAGSCRPSGGVAGLPAPRWGSLGRACGGAISVATGCTNGSVCAPRAVAPFVSGLCIEQAGDIPCPAGPFSAKRVFYTSATDGRSCSACQCGDSAGATCTATTRIYSGAMRGTCSGDLVAMVDGGACTALTGNPTVGVRGASVTPPKGGSCPPSGGQPVGTLTPAMPTTFCCVP